VRLIASGRASEILDLGDDRVLRRFKAGGDPEREALVMRHAIAHGYPVPHVLDITPHALVLERIDGPTMADELRRRVWRLRGHASLLARLHQQLHEIDSPAGLTAAGPGDRLLHLDLHPANVILSPNGPVVVDWTNARAGDPALDVALTWVIMETTGGRGHAGRLFIHSFLAHFDGDDVVGALSAAAERRLADVNVTDREREAVRELLRSRG
jgi:tRNA A-37 threonylcarbamoyl transferase component Bud32